MKGRKLMDTSILLCEEDHTFLLMHNNDHNENINNSKYEEKEHIEYLFQLEKTEFMSFNYCSNSTLGLVHFNDIRINAIDHIFNVSFFISCSFKFLVFAN